MALNERQRAFARLDDGHRTGVEVARLAGYSGSTGTLRKQAYRNRRNPELAALSERLRRLARGESVEEIDADAPESSSRGFVWVGNRRGPDREDGVERAELDSDLSPLEGPFRPQPGPQAAFAACEADLAIYGGGAGGGKSFGALYELAKWSHVSGYRGVIFRRTNPELTGGGGLWDESQEMFADFGGQSRGGHTLDWRWPSGARVEFRHMQRESDRLAHQGRQYALVIFDELTHFTEAQFWYLVGRLRSTCGVRPYLRATCNPDADSFVFDLVSWWIGEDGLPIAERSGVLRWLVRAGGEIAWFDTEADARAAHPGMKPMSFTFIAANVHDNRALLEGDPDYDGRLQTLGRVDRARLLDGNWKVRDGAGMVFRRDDFKLADGPPSRVIASVRFWDKASSEPTPKHPNPDWTRGVRMSLCEGGKLWIDNLVSAQMRAVDVLQLQRATAEGDGLAVTVGLWQDSGGAGLVDVDVTSAALAGFVVETVASFAADTTGTPQGTHRSSRAKRTFANAWSPWVERGDVYVLRGQPWTAELLGELEGFPDARFDDIADACSGAFQLLVGGGFGWWESIMAAANRGGAKR